MMEGSLRVVAVAVAVLAGGAGSGCQAGVSTTPLPPGPQVVELTLRDYRFDFAPGLEGGRVVFRVVNRGTVPHSATLLPLAEDIPPIEQQLRGSERRAIPPFAGVTPRQPGQRTSFAVDLVPGTRYAFVCFLTEPGGTAHALRGMAAEFRTGGVATTGGPSSTTAASRSG